LLCSTRQPLTTMGASWSWPSRPRATSSVRVSVLSCLVSAWKLASGHFFAICSLFLCLGSYVLSGVLSSWHMLRMFTGALWRRYSQSVFLTGKFPMNLPTH
jgi:hypothetical protein